MMRPLYVDVETGAVLEVHPTIHHALDRKVYSANNGTTLPGTLVRGESDPLTGDLDVDGVYDNLSSFYGAYYHFWGRDSYDNAGATLNATVHYSSNYCNAFWNGSQLVFGDCNGMITAAQQLGYDQATQDAVACAYAAIKVGTAPASCGGSPPPPPPGDIVLTNGTPVTNQADSVVGNMKYYSLSVPSGQKTLTFTISGGTGDADMYVSFGSKPAETSYQCRPYLNGNNETCTFTNPSAGTWYVGLRAYSAYSGVTLKGTYSTSSGCTDTVLTNGIAKTNLSGATGSAQYFCLPSVPSGKTLTISISGGTGDADLYTRFGARPTTSSFVCRPYVSGNNETCPHTTTAATAGDWYVMLRGYTAYSGVQLIGSY